MTRVVRVIVVGDLVTDVLVMTSGPVAFGSDTDARVSQRGGGAAANTACWLAECGVATALVARVGNDEAGRARTLELLGAGVDAVIATDDDAATGTVVVVIGADGERTMLADRGANRRLCVEDLSGPAFAGATHLHLSGYLFFDGGSRGAARYALARARSAGLTVSVDAASAAPLARIGAGAFLSWSGGADLLLANAEEAQVLTGSDRPGSAARQLSRHFGAAVVKAGAEGAVWAAQEEVVSCRALPASVVDTTGAGDAFAAGLLAAWLAGSAPAGALAAGAALAARAVAMAGGRPTDR